MKTRIILTGILKDNDLFLIVKRNENDDLYPGAWEFPGGHLEDGETLKAGLRRELEEEIGFIEDFKQLHPITGIIQQRHFRTCPIGFFLQFVEKILLVPAISAMVVVEP